MDFHLTKEQLLVRKMYREFAENEVKPLAAEIDEEERFPMETVEKMAKLGMMGIYFPKEYGGAGGPNFRSVRQRAKWQVLQLKPLQLPLSAAVHRIGHLADFPILSEYQVYQGFHLHISFQSFFHPASQEE